VVVVAEGLDTPQAVDIVVAVDSLVVDHLVDNSPDLAAVFVADLEAHHNCLDRDWDFRSRNSLVVEAHQRFVADIVRELVLLGVHLEHQLVDHTFAVVVTVV